MFINYNMLKHHPITSAIAVSLITAGSVPAYCQTVEARPTHGVELWRGLAEGMNPESLLPYVKAIEGVKRAKVVNVRKPERPKRVRITYEAEDIQIGSLPFKLDLRFSDAQLAQVWLASTNQCGEDTEQIYKNLSAGLVAKYPQVIYEAPLQRGDVLRAYSRSRESGERQAITHIFANDDVAVLLTFALLREGPPPNPGYGNRLARTLYSYALGEYRSRKSECGGTGDRRVDVTLQYMARAAFDEHARATSAEIKEEQEALVDQL